MDKKFSLGDDDDFMTGSGEPVDPEYQSPLLSDNDPKYVVDNKEVLADGAKSITKMFLWGIGGLIFILVTIYALFSATLMYLAPTTTNDDAVGSRLHVARSTFTADKIPSGTVMYGSATDQVSTGFLNNMTEGFTGVNNPIIVEVITGPVNVLDHKDGKLTVDGKKTKINSTMDRMVLDDQFLVKCLDGSCDPGSHFVIDVDGLSGQVVGKLDGTAYTAVKTAEDITKAS